MWWRRHKFVPLLFLKSYWYALPNYFLVTWIHWHSAVVHVIVPTLNSCQYWELSIFQLLNLSIYLHIWLVLDLFYRVKHEQWWLFSINSIKENKSSFGEKYINLDPKIFIIYVQLCVFRFESLWKLPCLFSFLGKAFCT